MNRRDPRDFASVGEVEALSRRVADLEVVLTRLSENVRQMAHNDLEMGHRLIACEGCITEIGESLIRLSGQVVR